MLGNFGTYPTALKGREASQQSLLIAWIDLKMRLFSQSTDIMQGNEIIILNRNLHPHVHCSTIHNTKDVQITYVANRE